MLVCGSCHSRVPKMEDTNVPVSPIGTPALLSPVALSPVSLRPCGFPYVFGHVVYSVGNLSPCSIDTQSLSCGNRHLTSGGCVLNPHAGRSISPEQSLQGPPIPVISPVIYVGEEQEKCWTSEDDKKVLERTRNELNECGWYYGSLSWQEANKLLGETKEGTFLVRDSASCYCLYSLSVQTSKGPTSIRILYSEGKFRLDCKKSMKGSVPERHSLVELIEHYVYLATSGSGSHMWVDSEGEIVGHIVIKYPYRMTVPSLQHMCRLTINRNKAFDESDCSPQSFATFLNSYPFKC